MVLKKRIFFSYFLRFWCANSLGQLLEPSIKSALKGAQRINIIIINKLKKLFTAFIEIQKVSIQK